MSGGGSKRPDTSRADRAAEESNALQERMYDESVARGMPFYDIGLSGTRTLADYLGLSGGESSKTREQFLTEFTPQYTSQVGSPEQQIVTGFNPDVYNNEGYLQSGSGDPIYGTSGGYTDEINYGGLNTAVDEAMASQAEGRPDYFGSLLKSFGQEDFQTDPGYQFRLDEGNKALERSSAARGQTFSPDASKALMGYGQDMASQEYMNSYNRFNQDQGNIYNRLAGISGMGQQQSQALTTAGTNYAGQVGQTNASLANVHMAADQQAQAGRSSMFGTLGAIAGGIGGAMVGGPQGAYYGATAGSAIGGGF